MSRRFAIVVALAACVAALPLQGQATAAVARYHVTLALLPGDDPAGVAKRLAAMYRGQLETPVDGAGAFTISLSEAQAELLRRDNSVGAVAADESSVVAASRPAAAPANGANLRVATTAVGSPWQSGTYLYDGTGNIKSIGSDVYVYDTNHRLVSADAGSSNAQSYTYDAFGNITGTTTVQAGSTSTIYLGANAATNRMDVTGVNLQTAAYDARGNVTSYQMQQFTYDAVDTVTKAYVDGKWRSYIYSASDERIGTIELSAANGSAIRSDWTVRDTSGKVLRRFSRENDGSWLWNQDYIYRDSQMLAAELPQTAKVYHYHLDHLGTPRLITGNGGVEIS
ncbi:MAG: YD repeat-containing protein, partial [Acidobacteriota bacterium]|nr:YD repeat-containing protein [Acidobacteriota bacterium]